MTEAEWLACDDPRAMLALVRGKVSRRKVGLWVVTHLRDFLPPGARFVEAVDVVERYVEGEGSEAEMDAMHATHHTSLVLFRGPGDPCDVAAFLFKADRGTAGLPARLLRDVLGNPFRPVGCDPAWRTDTAVSLARGIYESRDFGAMPILADALQDAGCDNLDVLNHCRDATVIHTRGCWVVDLVLAKE